MKETYKNHTSIPQIPVPELGETLEIYIRCLKPLVDDVACERTAALADEFAKNEGRLLQHKLLE